MIFNEGRLSVSDNIVSTVEPGYNGHPWGSTYWLLYRGDLRMQ